MSHINLQLPNSLYQKISQLAKLDNTTINEFINMTLTEKVTEMSQDFVLLERSKRGDQQKFMNALSKVANRPPVQGDER